MDGPYLKPCPRAPSLAHLYALIVHTYMPSSPIPPCTHPYLKPRHRAPSLGALGAGGIIARDLAMHRIIDELQGCMSNVMCVLPQTLHTIFPIAMHRVIVELQGCMSNVMCVLPQTLHAMPMCYTPRQR